MPLLPPVTRSAIGGEFWPISGNWWSNLNWRQFFSCHIIHVYCTSIHISINLFCVHMKINNWLFKHCVYIIKRTPYLDWIFAKIIFLIIKQNEGVLLCGSEGLHSWILLHSYQERNILSHCIFHVHLVSYYSTLPHMKTEHIDNYL